jgi:hypothetical protein
VSRWRKSSPLRSLPTTGIVRAPAPQTVLIDPAQERRLRELYRLQGDPGLSDVEREEMSVLVGEYNHRAYERGVQAIAARDGREVTEVAAALDAERARVIAWYAELDADPVRRSRVASPPS